MRRPPASARPPLRERAGAPSMRSEVQLLDDLDPFDGIALDEFFEFVRRVRMGRLVTRGQHALPELLVLEPLPDRRVELRDDRLRRAARSHETVPEDALADAERRGDQARNAGKERRGRARADADPAQGAA